MKHLLLIVAFFTLYSCSGDFKKVEVLNEFRILAIIADQPEVLPSSGGIDVRLQLYVSDVNGGGRRINGTTVACIDPGISSGAEVNCDHDPSAAPGIYEINTTNGDMGIANLFTGLASDELIVTVPEGIFTGRSTTEQFNGVSFLVIFNFIVDGKAVTVFKRIIATNRGGILNTNSLGSVLFVNGAAPGLDLNKGDKLNVTTGAPQVYDFINDEGNIESKSEVFQAAWFVTQGNFDRPKSDVDETVEYLGETPAAPSLVVSIVRDDRGAVQVVRQLFP